jgi:hypothetical protein
MADPVDRRVEQPLHPRERRAWRWWSLGILVVAVVLGVGMLLLPVTGEGLDPVPEEAIGQTQDGAR